MQEKPSPAALRRLRNVPMYGHDLEKSLILQPFKKVISGYINEVELKNEAYEFISEKNLFNEFKKWSQKKVLKV
jgi:hypothetical protein